jgi:hypothetical protein
VPNPDLLLKTDMYATVEIAAPVETVCLRYCSLWLYW